MWGSLETDEELAAAGELLESAGADFSQTGIDNVIASIGPVPLTEGGLRLLSEAQRLEYEHEQKAWAAMRLGYSTLLSQPAK
jgi:hypothetical protein